ncbi:hypothetical protein ACFVP8_07615, partial [Viridibacillus arvi]|uniref:hypothetical protein n=1 Tax=Viridibacillus arvi TaxID=263475 RepID=UPI0036C0389F
MIEKIKCIPEDVLTFFYYSCSISIALLALTAIIFTIYNERTILKVEKLVSNLDTQENDEISIRLDKINSLLLSNNIYELTKGIVIITVSLSVILWIIVFTNKVLKAGENYIIVIFLILATSLILVSIIVIP